MLHVSSVKNEEQTAQYVSGTRYRWSIASEIQEIPIEPFYSIDAPRTHRTGYMMFSQHLHPIELGTTPPTDGTGLHLPREVDFNVADLSISHTTVHTFPDKTLTP